MMREPVVGQYVWEEINKLMMEFHVFSLQHRACVVFALPVYYLSEVFKACLESG